MYFVPREPRNQKGAIEENPNPEADPNSPWIMHPDSTPVPDIIIQVSTEGPAPGAAPVPLPRTPSIPLPEPERDRPPSSPSPITEFMQSLGQILNAMYAPSRLQPLEFEPLQSYQPQRIQAPPSQYRLPPIELQSVQTGMVKRAIEKVERHNPLLETQVISEEQVRQRAREVLRSIAETKGKDPVRLERYIPDGPIEYVDPASAGPSLADIFSPAREERPFQRRVSADYWRQYEKPYQRGSVLDRLQAEQNVKLARQKQSLLDKN